MDLKVVLSPADIAKILHPVNGTDYDPIILDDNSVPVAPPPPPGVPDATTLAVSIPFGFRLNKPISSLVQRARGKRNGRVDPKG